MKRFCYIWSMLLLFMACSNKEDTLESYTARIVELNRQQKINQRCIARTAQEISLHPYAHDTLWILQPHSEADDEWQKSIVQEKARLLGVGFLAGTPQYEQILTKAIDWED